MLHAVQVQHRWYRAKDPRLDGYTGPQTRTGRRGGGAMSGNAGTETCLYGNIDEESIAKCQLES